MPLYRSKLDSPLAVNGAKYRDGGLSPLNADPTKYRSHEASTLLASTWTPPNFSAIWGWFKHNEGAGTTIIDYGPVAVNAWLETSFGDPTGKFWSVPGFGHNDNTGYYTWMLRTTAGARDTDYVSMVGFIKPINYGEFVFRGAMQLGEGGTANWLRIGWRDDTTRNWAVRSGNLSSVRYSTATFSFNTWYCLFAYASSEVGVQKIRLYVRSSGNPFSLVIDEPYDYNIKGTQIGLYGFGSNNGNYIMDGGDMLYYASATSEGVISVSQADDIYDNLKARYGMS